MNVVAREKCGRGTLMMFILLSSLPAEGRKRRPSSTGSRREYASTSAGMAVGPSRPRAARSSRCRAIQRRSGDYGPHRSVPRGHHARDFDQSRNAKPLQTRAIHIEREERSASALRMGSLLVPRDESQKGEPMANGWRRRGESKATKRANGGRSPEGIAARGRPRRAWGPFRTIVHEHGAARRRLRDLGLDYDPSSEVVKEESATEVQATAHDPTRQARGTRIDIVCAVSATCSSRRRMAGRRTHPGAGAAPLAGRHSVRDHDADGDAAVGRFERISAAGFRTFGEVTARAVSANESLLIDPDCSSAWAPPPPVGQETWILLVHPVGEGVARFRALPSVGHERERSGRWLGRAHPPRGDRHHGSRAPKSVPTISLRSTCRVPSSRASDEHRRHRELHAEPPSARA